MSTPRKRPREEAVLVTPAKPARAVKREVSILRDFDMNLKYGPSRGLSREQRFRRAVKFGLDPPMEVLKAIKAGDSQMSVLDDRCSSCH